MTKKEIEMLEEINKLRDELSRISCELEKLRETACQFEAEASRLRAELEQAKRITATNKKKAEELIDAQQDTDFEICRYPDPWGFVHEVAKGEIPQCSDCARLRSELETMVEAVDSLRKENESVHAENHNIRQLAREALEEYRRINYSEDVPYLALRRIAGESE